MKKYLLPLLGGLLIETAIAHPGHEGHGHQSHSNHSMNMNHMDHMNANNDIIQEIANLMHEPMMSNAFVQSGNPNIDFLSNMVPHHQGAVLSSEKLLEQKNLSPEIKTLAENIIREQKQEIRTFNRLLKKPKDFDQPIDKATYATFVEESKQDMAQMMEKMAKADFDSLETAYAASMIEHHTGAIVASKQILEITKNQEIRKIAHDIIRAQEREIQQFQDFIQSKNKY